MEEAQEGQIMSEQDETRRVIEETWAKLEVQAFLAEMKHGADKLVSNFCTLGDEAFEHIESNPNINNYLLTYEWPNIAKSFLVLWRDVFFELKKARIKVLDKKAEQEDWNRLKIKSKEVILNASDKLGAYVKNETERLERLRSREKKQIEKWNLQINPYPTYREQFGKIASQCQFILDQYESLENVFADFNQIEITLNDSITHCIEDVNSIQDRSTKILEFVKNNLEEKPDKLPTYIEEKVDEILIMDHQDIFRSKLDISLNQLPGKKDVPIGISGGQVQVKEIVFQKRVNRWLEAEILPVLYDIWETTKNTSNGLKMALLNIRNRSVNLLNESKLPDLKEEGLTIPLEDFARRAKTYESRLKELSDELNSRLSREFRVSSIYDPNQVFLPIGFQSTVDQFDLEENEWWQSLSRWINRQRGNLQEMSAAVTHDQSLSFSEKIVRFVQSRKILEEHHAYSSIFLTKGYIGESFWVGRKVELARMETLVRQWHQNYRGAVMLTGQRFCGKTLFGSLVVKRFFSGECIQLRPNIEINIDGRKHPGTFDLASALEFIKKYSVNKKRLIWIDDLELWNDPNHPLSTDIHTLQRHIDNFSRQNFFMVSMSNWLKARLQKIYDIEKIFQAEINLDVMSLEEVRHAIGIRHGATQKNLVNEQGEEINHTQLTKITKKIHKIANGNIGESLLEWTSATNTVGEKDIVYKSNPMTRLPSFLNPDTAVLLSTIMMEKRTNEYRLQKKFGMAFKERFGNILQRLLSIGFITRYPDGWLEINDVAVNEVGELLHNHGYLKYFNAD